MRGHNVPSTPASATGPVLLVLVGGAVGTLVRAISEETFAAGPGEWPWTTFAINVSGSFMLGLLVSALAARGDDSGRRRRLRLALGTGILGGFTTYSTFIVEVDQLLRDGVLGLGTAYALGSVVAGVLAAGLGVLLGGARTTPVDPDEIDEDAS